MADGIAKGVGEQLGELGKQIVKDIASVPGKLTGLDSSGVDESSGSTMGGKQQQVQKQSAQQVQKQAAVQRMAQIKQKDEAEKQKQLAQARDLLRQFTQPQGEQEMTVAQKQEMEEMEKKKKEIEEEKQAAAKILPRFRGKRARGDLYGIKGKQFTGETGKNIKSG